MTGLTFLTPDAQYDDGAGIERAETGGEATWHVHRARTLAELSDAELRAADAVVTWHVMPIDRDFISRLDRCRIIVRAGVGVDHIDLAAAGEAGIPVCNTPDYGVSEVADHAIGMMLALRRGLVAHGTSMRADPEAAFRSPPPPLVARNRGGTFGVVGFGAIGMATAARARAFGMRVLVHDPYATSGVEIAFGVDRTSRLDDLLGQADVVSLHCPLTPETRGLFGRNAFARMKPGAILINTARGPVVDMEAMIEALEAGRLGGAGIDVFETEPLPANSPLGRFLRSRAPAAGEGRLILTPHSGWASPESARDVRRLSVETAMIYLRKGRLRNAVNLAYVTNRRSI